MMMAMLVVLVPASLGTPTRTFQLTCHLVPTDERALEYLFWAVSTPGTPEYQQFRGVQELAELIGGTQESVDAASAFLRAHGGSTVRLSPLRDRVDATFHHDAVNSTHWSHLGMPVAAKPRGTSVVIRTDAGAQKMPMSPYASARLWAQEDLYSISALKQAYGIPLEEAASHPNTLQMVWGPGTFGYSPADLRRWSRRECPSMALDKISFDTAAHGERGGDNFGEGSLDVRMIASFGLNASTLVSNTNTSASTEEGVGFGAAMLSFVSELSSRPVVPHVLSLSLGSLSVASCELLCARAVATSAGRVTAAQCAAYLQTQRQVCMFASKEQVARINTGLMALGARGVSVLGSSGDGGSHWSFGPFSADTEIGRLLNTVGCEYNFPIFPSPSPYMTSVGGTQWEHLDPARPVAWPGSGGGFSWQFGAPDHQARAVAAYLNRTGSALPPSGSYRADGRAYPDVAAIARMGTSQSAPVVAGIVSLLVDRRLRSGLPPLGFLGPRLYQVAERFPGEAFEDVTQGNSKTSCETGFPATKGWDPVTGWGRPVWSGLVKHFASDGGMKKQGDSK